MSKVKIITDSGVFLPTPGAASRLGIEIVPLTVKIGRQSYAERANASDEVFFQKMAANPKSVSVATPSVARCQAMFAELSRTNDLMVAIHTSAALHGLAATMQRAAGGFIGRQRIVVLDSLTVSSNLGLIVEAAGQAAADGASQAEIVKIVRGMIPHMYALMFSDSLEYLESWGRLGSAQALLGTMLNLKPLATMEDGDFIPIEKVRNYARAVDKLFEFVVEFSHVERLSVMQNGMETEAAQLLERLETTFPRREFPVIGYGPSLAVHVGPRALGVAVYEGAR